jgi:integrase
LGAGKSKDVWLPEMRRYKSKDAVLSNVNVHLKIWCRDKGIDEFSTYAVRKTWATLARRYEDKSIANEAMGHSGGNRMLDIYAEKPYERYHDLSEKVLDLFWWE